MQHIPKQVAEVVIAVFLAIVSMCTLWKLLVFLCNVYFSEKVRKVKKNVKLEIGLNATVKIVKRFYIYVFPVKLFICCSMYRRVLCVYLCGVWYFLEKRRETIAKNMI